MKVWALMSSLFALSAAAESSLTLQSYLQQVSGKNLDVQSARESAEGAAQRSREGHLLLSPTLFSEAEAARDSRLPQISFFAYDRIENEKLVLGVRKLTTFGLEAKAYYSLVHTNIVNPALPTVPGGAGSPSTNYFDTRPTIELTQSLWGNGFGRTTRANQEALEAQASATHLSSRFRLKSLLAGAEETYWRLTLTREREAVARAALEQAEKIHGLSRRRASNNLGDRADLLQAAAALKVRQLETQAATDEERAARRAFNRLRNIEGDAVSETLEPLDAKKWAELQIKAPAGHREDVQAAEQQQRAATAAAEAAIEKDTPTLDVYGSYALNGRQDSLGSSLGDPFTAGRPSYAIGMKLMVPLDRSAANDAQAGWVKERNAAELSYRQKLLDEAQDWRDLSQRFDETKRRLVLAQAIAEAQNQKLTYERQRLRQGRTTTFQVLTFEQDYAQSRLAEIAAKAELVRVVTQLKLYHEGATL